jgi:hypothetical protein
MKFMSVVLPASVGADQAGDAGRNDQAHVVDAQHFAIEARDVDESVVDICGLWLTADHLHAAGFAAFIGPYTAPRTAQSM